MDQKDVERPLSIYKQNRHCSHCIILYIYFKEFAYCFTIYKFYLEKKLKHVFVTHLFTLPKKYDNCLISFISRIRFRFFSFHCKLCNWSSKDRNYTRYVICMKQKFLYFLDNTFKNCKLYHELAFIKRYVW